MTWRRLCIDLDQEGTVRGLSIEFRDSLRARPVATWTTSTVDPLLSPHAALDELLQQSWAQGTLWP
jgi:hypothetical protein